MSHFSRIQTMIIEKPFLLQAIRDLGFQFEEGDLPVRGFMGQRAQAEIAIRMGTYDIGLRRTGSNYEIVADWTGIHGVSQLEFTQRLTQRYAYHTARARLEEQGFTMVDESVQETGQIRLVLRRITN
jgi:hypothetical protein